MTPTKQYLKSLDACSDAIDWIGDRTLRQAWDECENGSWMLCLAEKQGVDVRKLTLTKAKCARLNQHLIKDSRSVDFLDVAERFGNGEATAEELEAAANAAKDAVTDAKAAYAYAAYTAFQYLMKDSRSVDFLDVAERFGNGEATAEELKTAANAATDAKAAYAVDVVYAYAAYASAKAVCVLYDLYAIYDANTVYANTADYVAYAVTPDKQRETLRQCADICREVLTEHMDFSGEVK